MRYYQNNSVLIRAMMKNDIEKIVDGFTEQKWQKPKKLYVDYYNRQENKEHKVIVAEVNNQVAGYVTLLPKPSTGPFVWESIPEIVDLNVFIKYQKQGIGNKLMDVAEGIAKENHHYVSLAVGLHSGYGSAQRMYVKRGYIPDGSGVWYKGKQLEQYANCANDDDLTLYFLKHLKLKN